MYREFRGLDSILAGAEQGVLLTELEDPSTVFGFCGGDDPPLCELPINSIEAEDKRAMDGRARAHYTACPLWQREKARIEIGADAIFPKPTSRPRAADTLDVLRQRGVLETDSKGQTVLAQSQDASTPIDWLMDEDE